MYLAVTNAVQGYDDLPALTLGHEMMILFLVLRDHALAQRAKRRFWLYVP